MHMIGVAIPTYNRKEYLQRLLSSIPANVNVSVSDNGAFVTPDVKSKYPNAAFLAHGEVIEIFENWNAAARGVKEEWAIIPSDDDLFFPEAFDKAEQYIQKYPQADIFIFGHYLIDENDQLLEKWSHDKEVVFKPGEGFSIFRHRVNARMPSLLFRRSFLEGLDFFDTDFKLTSADSLLVQKALLKGTAVFVPEIIGAYRVWSGSFTSRKIATKQWLDEIDLWQDKIGKMVVEAGVMSKQEFAKIKDEVYADNLLAGVRVLKKNGSLSDIFTLLKENRFPWKAAGKTKLRILKAMIVK